VKLIFDIALSHIRARRRQTLVSTAGVMMGVGFSIAIAALLEGSQRDFLTRIVDYLPHVVVKDEYREPPVQPSRLANPLAAVFVRGIRPHDEERGLKDPMAKVRALEDIPGARVAPALRTQIFLRYGGKDVAVAAMGVEPQRERLTSRLELDMTAGSLMALETGANGIIIGVGLARKLGVEMNGILTAVSAAGVSMKMKVVGMYRTGIVTLDESEIYMLLKKAQILAARPNVVSQIRLRLDEPTAAVEVAQAIEARWGYKTESWQEANEGFLSFFTVRNFVMYATVSAILIVASFGIFNIVSTVVFEKTRDIAILKSMGFDPGDIRAVFLVEGLVVGIIGTLLGWGLGWALCQGLAQVRFEIKLVTEVQGFLLYYSWVHYAVAGLVAAVSATLASWLPARKAARVNPVEIIRGAA